MPQILLRMINVKNENKFLMNKCLTVLNNIMSHSTETNQQKMLDILKEDNLFFNVFFYISVRLEESKDYTIAKIKQSAKKKFFDLNISTKHQEKVKPNDFNRQKIYYN